MIFRIYFIIITYLGYGVKENTFLTINGIKRTEMEVEIKIFTGAKRSILILIIYCNITSTPTSLTKDTTIFIYHMIIT